MMRCSLVKYLPKCQFAAAPHAPHAAAAHANQPGQDTPSHSAAPASASFIPVSVVCVVDQVYVPHIEVTRAAGNWARIVIRAPPDLVHAYVSDALHDAMAMLRAVGPCGSTALSLDAVHVGGPNYVDGLTAEICHAWQAIASATAPSSAPSSAPIEALARVLERAATGGAPDFTGASARARAAARNYVVSTRGNSKLCPEEIAEVCDALRELSLSELP